MNRIFCVRDGIAVPDGTVVHSVIDPGQLQRDGLLMMEELSVALGALPSGTKSRIHVHPIVHHLTWVLSGKLTLKMKDTEASSPYMLDLAERQAAITEPGTFFQLINRSNAACQALYIVSPAFVLEIDDRGEVRYNDAVVLDATWGELAQLKWKIPELVDLQFTKKKRNEAIKRLSIRPPD